MNFKENQTQKILNTKPCDKVDHPAVRQISAFTNVLARVFLIVGVISFVVAILMIHKTSISADVMTRYKPGGGYNVEIRYNGLIALIFTVVAIAGVVSFMFYKAISGFLMVLADISISLKETLAHLTDKDNDE